ncbi:MAG: sulfotransferase, partial [Bacteroidota bacterium]
MTREHTPTFGPDFVVAGVARSGTTSLYRYLQEHPEIHLPGKETFFFNAASSVGEGHGQPHLPRAGKIRDPEQFRAHYARPNDQRLVGEVATGYLFDHAHAVPAILETLGDIPILLLLRNPIERAYSCYWHLSKNTRESLPFEAALEQEAARTEQGWDFMYRYRAAGLYTAGVRAFQQHFSRVGVYLYDDLKQDPMGLMRDLYAFLGVDPTFAPSASTVHNASGEVVNPGLQQLITRPNPVKRLLRPLWRLFLSEEKRQRVRDGLKQRNLRPAPPMHPDTHRELAEYFRT